MTFVEFVTYGCEQGSDLFEMYVFCCMYCVSNRPSNVDEMGTGNYRRGLCTCARLRLDHMSTYDWTINETDKTNVARDDDVVLR